MSDAKPTLTLGDLRKFADATDLDIDDPLRSDGRSVIHAEYSDGVVHIITSSNPLSINYVLYRIAGAPDDAPVFVDGDPARFIGPDEDCDETISISTEEQEAA